MLQSYPSRSKALTFFAAVVLLLLGAHLLFSTDSVPTWRLPSSEAVSADAPSEEQVLDLLDSVAEGQRQDGFPNAAAQFKSPPPPPCQRLPGGEDVVVIMRTGATEVQDKLPMHFNTTFKCYSDLVIFSDYEETFEGYQLHDVLAPMDQSLKENNKDFEIYRRLKNHGRQSLHPEELSGTASFEGSKSGKGENPGWKLDKWKFLPMMNETLRLRPDKKWYIFVESDSYPVWSNMLQFLARFDPSEPHYYGSEVQIGPDIFAHGGSVFVMSKPAIEAAAKYYADNREWWDNFTDGHWAGDCVLGKELLEAGVPLEFSWPVFQGGHPEKMDFTEKKGEEKKLWCSTAVSYHHLSFRELPRMWDFEQAWIQSRLDKASKAAKRWPFRQDYSDVLEHRDVFKKFVWPRIQTHSGVGWNNLSPNIIGETTGVSIEGCRKQCEQNPGCMQYVVGEAGCAISTREVMLGEEAEGYTSGWMPQRIETWMSSLDKCGRHEGWTAP